MNSDLIFAFALVAALQAKHFICDGPLQTLGMVREKSIYGRPLGLLHAGIHGLGTAVVMLAFSASAGTIALLAALDAILHYHIDFTKENLVKRQGWTVSAGPFWWSLVGDQWAHHFTYLVLAYLALTS